MMGLPYVAEYVTPVMSEYLYHRSAVEFSPAFNIKSGKLWKPQAGRFRFDYLPALPTPSMKAHLSEAVSTNILLSRSDYQVAEEEANKPVSPRSARLQAKSSKALSSGPTRSCYEGAIGEASANKPAARSIAT